MKVGVRTGPQGHLDLGAGLVRGTSLDTVDLIHARQHVRNPAETRLAQDGAAPLVIAEGPFVQLLAAISHRSSGRTPDAVA